jgi:hypothetical protein
MKTLFALLALAVSAGMAPAQTPPSLPRFSIRTDALALSNCLAQPGGVRLQLAPENPSLEILDWSALPGTNQTGEFTIRFRAPTPVGSVIAYDGGEVSFLTGGSWQKLDPGTDDRRRLQVFPLLPGVLVEAVKFIIPAEPIPAADGKPAQFKATLPFATFIPIRAVNIAVDAAVTVSSTAPGAKPASLNDGEVDARQNFSTARHAAPLSSTTSEWVMLNWSALRPIRGMAFLRGSEDAGFGQNRIEVFTGEGDPRDSRGTNGWMELTGRSTAPGRFRANQFFVSMRSIEARAVRITSTGGVDRVSAGEIAVFPDLGSAPAASAFATAEVQTLAVPKVATNAITIDGRAGDWPTQRVDGFALAFDEERLHLLYQAGGELARFENAGTNINELFHTGDAVELLLQTQPGAVPQRPAPVRGDVRLVFSIHQGKPVCVLYDYSAEDLLLVPVQFRTGSRVTECDKVSRLGGARVELRREPSSLTLEASVPLAALGLRPEAFKETRGDLGRVVGAPDRPVAVRRVYWANRHAPPAGDLAAEAALQPAQWGVFRFGGQGSAP